MQQTVNTTISSRLEALAIPKRIRVAQVISRPTGRSSAVASNRILQLAQPRKGNDQSVSRNVSRPIRSNAAPISDRLRELAAPRNPKAPVVRKTFPRASRTTGTVQPPRVSAASSSATISAQNTLVTDEGTSVTGQRASDFGQRTLQTNASILDEPISEDSFTTIPAAAASTWSVMEGDLREALITADDSHPFLSVSEETPDEIASMDTFSHRRRYLEHIAQKRLPQRHFSEDNRQPQVSDSEDASQGSGNCFQELRAIFGN